MNEYEVTVREDDGERVLVVEAATAALARDAAEARSDGEILIVRFVRALGFGCRIRTGELRR